MENGLNALCIVLHELHGIGLHLFALRAVKYVALCCVALCCVALCFVSFRTSCFVIRNVSKDPIPCLNLSISP